MTPQTVKKNLQEILRNIKDLNTTFLDKGTIIGVTKNHTQDHIKAAQLAGITNIGESRVQEAEKKIKKFQHKNLITLHLIGHLQTNKTKKAVSLFDIIQTVDSQKLAEKINKEAKKINKKQKIFLQINISKDPQKRGLLEQEVLFANQNIQKLSNIEISGLMTITANHLNEYELRKCYEKMRKIRNTIQSEGLYSCVSLSMGMSNDYLYAIKEGATHIRIGTLLFGERGQ